MMESVVEVEINGKTVFFEQDGHEAETEQVGGISHLGSKMAGTFEHALDTIDTVISSTVQRIRAFDKKIAPDKFQMEFGVTLSGEYGAVVTKVAGEAQFVVKVTYKHNTSKTTD